MISSSAFALWLTCASLSVLACTLILVRDRFRQHAALWCYLALLVSSGALEFAVLSQYGFTPREYQRAYYLADCLLTIAMCAAVLELYLHMFPSNPGRQLVYFFASASALLASVFSIARAMQAQRAPLGWVEVELSRSLYVVAMLAVVGLFYPSLWNRRVPMQVYQLVLVFGVLAALRFGMFAVHQLYPRREFPFDAVSHYLAALWLPLGVAYAFSSRTTDRRQPLIRP